MDNSTQPLLFFEDPLKIKERTQEITKNFRKTQQDLLAVPHNSQNWQTIVGKFSDSEAEVFDWLWTNELMAKVAPREESRKESNQSIKELKDIQTEIWTKTDLYQLFKKVDSSDENLGNEEKRTLKTYISLFERNGSNLPLEKRQQLESISKQISELSIKFLQNVNEDTSFIVAEKEDLEGMSEDFIQGLQKEGNGYKVTMKYPDALPILRQAKRHEIRHRVTVTYNNRCKDENLGILKQVVLLRQEAASILGFESHSSYILQPRMAKDPQQASSFLNSIREKLVPLAKEEMKQLLLLKEEEKKLRNEEYQPTILESESSYYINMLKEKQYAIKEEDIRQYFPLNFVTEKMLQIYQEILGLKFVENTVSSRWHPDVKAFEVYEVEDGKFVGNFFLDLFPRDGKYSHACAYPVIDGLYNEKVKTPVAVMVANFPKPTETRPSLLYHREVITFFHEFGHVMHSICSRSKYTRLAWFNVEMDYVEAPSQMLENWCWEKEVLKRISGHYQTGEPLPDDLITSIIAAKNVCIGLGKLRQIGFSLYDLQLHSDSQFITKESHEHVLSERWNESRKSVSLIEATPETHYVASWLHLCAGYDSGYYGYLWSEVFADDMFSRFLQEGVLNPKVGKDYRTHILQPGASKDGSQMLENFLHRKPDEKSFLRSLGIQ